MASELAAYYVSIVPSAKGLTQSISKEFSGIDGEAKKAGKSSGGAFTGAFKSGMGGIGAAFAAAGIGSFVSSAVQGAGQLEQSVGAIESVFKDSSAQMQQWSKSAATDVGLTANEFNELGTLIGAQLKNGGTAMDQLAPKTQGLIGLGADLSSMFGGTTSEAVAALSSALKGERDPIEKFGVSLSQAKVDAEAAALGFEKVGGSLSAEATQAATMSLIMKQTSDAHGNFAKESDTFAHKQQVMSAKWGDLSTKMGGLFLPAFSGVIGFISDKAVPVFEEIVGGVTAFGAAWTYNDGEITSSGFPGFMERVGYWARQAFDYFNATALPVLNDFGGYLTGTVIPAVVEFGKFLWDNRAALVVIAAAVTAYVAVMGTMSIISTVRGWLTAAAAAQWGLNAAMSANPIGIVVAVLAGLVAGLVWFFTQTELGQKIWKNVWAAIGTAIKWVWESVIRPVFDTLSNFITKTIPKAFEDGVGFIKKIWDGLQEIAKAPIRFVIDTVLNDGLIGAFNTVAGFLGAKQLDRISIPGFADGGYTGDGGKHKPAGIVHAGEYVFTKEQTAAIGKDRLAAFAAGASPFAGESADLWGGLQEEIKSARKLNVSGSAPAWSLPSAIRAWDGAAGLAVRPGSGGPETNVSTFPLSNIPYMPEYAVGYMFEDGSIGLDSLSEGRLSPTLRKAAATHEIGHVLGLPHTNRNSIMHPMLANASAPTAFDMANLERMYGAASVPAGDIGQAGGDNPITGIIDMLMDKFKNAFPQGGALIDLVGAVGKKILTGAADFITGLFAGPRDGSDAGQGVTPTLYDGGGWLENTGGAQLVQHNKRKPDAVLSSGQWATMTKIADNAGGSFEGNLYLDSGEFLGKVRGAARQEIAMADSGSQFMRRGR